MDDDASVVSTGSVPAGHQRTNGAVHALTLATVAAGIGDGIRPDAAPGMRPSATQG